MDPMLEQLLKHESLKTDLLGEYFKTVIQSAHIRNQNGANLVYNHGKHTAKQLELGEEHMKGITPFPSTTNITMNTELPSEEGPVKSKEEESGGPLKKAVPFVLTALLGAGVPTIGLLAWDYFSGDDKPAPVEQEHEHDPSSVGVTVE